MPLVVALVGIIGTLMITHQQGENARELGTAQIQSAVERSKADRQIRVLEIFAEKITSAIERDRILALRILEELDIRSLAINDDGHIFAGTGSGVFRSTNNGDTWAQTGVAGLGFVFSLAINSKGRIFAGTLSGGVFRSTESTTN